MRRCSKLRVPDTNVPVAPPPGIEASPLSRAQVIGYIDRQTCPFCGAGPFKVLGIHIAQAHNITTSRFRAHYGISERHTTSSPETSARFRARTLARMADPEYRAELDTHLKKAQAVPQKGRQMPAEQADKTRRGTTKTCPVCEADFYSSPSTHGRYCGNECYWSTVHERWEDPEFVQRIRTASKAAQKAARKVSVCTVCGAEFWAENGGRGTCSKECSTEAYRRAGGATLKRWREDHPQKYLQMQREAIRHANDARRGTHAAQIDVVCPTCGVAFRGWMHKGRPPKYCSQACYRMSRRTVSPHAPR